MTLNLTYGNRLRKGLVRIDAEAPGGWNSEALAALRRSLERTIARLEQGTGVGDAMFRFQLTGGKPMLFQRNEVLPVDSGRLLGLLNSMEVELLAGEGLDLHGDLAAWLIRPELNVTDTNLRHAEENLRSLKSTRDRDHSASQIADSLKTRLRSRLTQLVGALQAAQDTEANA